MKKVLVLVICGFCFGLFAQQDNKGYISLKSLSAELKDKFTKDKNFDKGFAPDQRVNFMNANLDRVFRKGNVKTDDVKYLPAFFDDLDDDYREASLFFFDMNEAFDDKEQIADDLIKMTGNSYETEVRLASLMMLKQVKSKKSIPALKNIVTEFPYGWEKFKMKFMYDRDLYVKNSIPILAAQALCYTKDKESVNLVFDYADKLGPKCYRALAESGSMATQRLLDLSYDEIVNKKDGWAFGALKYTPKEDKEALNAIRNMYLSLNGEWEHREAYFKSILFNHVLIASEKQGGLEDREFLKQLQIQYDTPEWEKIPESFRYSIMSYSKAVEDLPFLRKVLKTSKDTETLSGAIDAICAATDTGDLRDFMRTEEDIEILKWLYEQPYGTNAKSRIPGAIKRIERAIEAYNKNYKDGELIK